MSRKFVLSLAGGLIAASPVFAEDLDQVAARPDVATYSVSDVIVSANRTAQKADRIGASVTVLTQADITASQSTTVVEMLSQTPGVNYTRNGGPGNASSLHIRGAEGHHTVVLIDGVKLNDPSATQGGFNFGNLMVGDTGRIEVLRGAQSTLWGSQAIGGVVNLVTAVPTKPFEGHVSAEAGSYDTRLFKAAAGGANDRLVWRLAANRYESEGYSAYAKGSEADGYRNTGLSGRLNFKLNDSVSLDLRSVLSRGTNDYDGWGTDSREYGNTDDWVAYAGVNFDLFEGRFKNRIGYALTETDRATFNPDNRIQTTTYEATGENRRWDYQGAFAVTDNLNTTFGIETERAEMNSRSMSDWMPDAPFLKGKSQHDSAYGQVQWTILDGLTVTGGLRYDDHDRYGDDVLGQLAAVWSPNAGKTTLRASWGQGFRAPGLYELYSEYGNLDLQAEHFDSWDIGIQHRVTSQATLGLTYFNRDTDNEIRYNSCTSGTTDPMCQVNGSTRWGYYKNVQHTQAQGVEATALWAPTQAISVSANYTWTDAKNASGTNDGKRLTRRPEHMGNLLVDYGWSNGLKTGLAVRYSGKAFANEANSTEIKAYTLVDLRLSYPVSDTLELYGRVENLFDETYQTVPDYGTAGRSAYGGIRVKF